MRQVGIRRLLVRGRSEGRLGCYLMSLVRNFSSKSAAGTVAAAQSPSPPFLMLPSGWVNDGEENYHLFSVSEKKVTKIKKKFGIFWRRHYFYPEGDTTLCCGSSSYGWQAFVKKRNCQMFLFNPLGDPLKFSHTIITLPPIETIRDCFSSFHPQKIISSTPTTECFDVDSEYKLFRQDFPTTPEEYMTNHGMSKFVLSSPPLTTGDENYSYNKDCLVMAKTNYRRCRFVWCRPGDTSWTSLDVFPGILTSDDFTYFTTHQLFYSLTDFGLLESWDLWNPNPIHMKTLVYDRLPPIKQPTMDERQIDLRVECSGNLYYHLVDSSGKLLLVVRYCEYRYVDVDCNGEKNKTKEKELREFTVAFDVYNFDFSKKKWVYVPDLGDDCVLFLSLNSFSVSLSDNPPGLQGLITGNCIYFSFGGYRHEKPTFHDSSHNRPRFHDSGVYNLTDGSITTFLPECFSSQNNQISSFPPMWIHPQCG